MKKCAITNKYKPPILILFWIISATTNLFGSHSIFLLKEYGNWTVLFSSIVYIGLIGFIIWQRHQQKKLKEKMEIFQAQLNPHFIANSLNAIESLVNQNDRETASKYLVHFSRLFRHLLNTSPTSIVNLSEELKQIKHFLLLEQLRFRDKLVFKIEVQKGLNPKMIEIPTMIIQPYVENAIWQGIKPKSTMGLLKINIQKERKYLNCIIEDNGIGRGAALQLKKKSFIKHKSQGPQISEKRLQRIGKIKGTKVQIIDLINEKGESLGTKTILRIPFKNRIIKKSINGSPKSNYSRR